MKGFCLIAIVYLGIGGYLFAGCYNLIEEFVRYDENCYPSDGDWYNANERSIFPKGGPFYPASLINWCKKSENVIYIKEDLPAD